MGVVTAEAGGKRLFEPSGQKPLTALETPASTRAAFPTWKQAYERRGNAGLAHKQPVVRSHPNRTPDEVVEKALYPRRTYRLGPVRIVRYLDRYHAVTISDAGVCRVLRRHGLNRLPQKVERRALYARRYSKPVPGH